MAKIVFVHGMNMHSHEYAKLKADWYSALIALLKRTQWGNEHPDRLPKEEDVELAYWADLMRRPNFDEEAQKGIGSLALDGYYAFLRGLVKFADKTSWFGKDGRPSFGFAELLDGLVAQTTMYMHNAAVYHPNPDVADGAFFQVQARFRAALGEDTELVIAHSLGSVVAYEGLYWKPSRVKSLITVGSPMASPDLILKPLRERAVRLVPGSVSAHPDNAILPWPRGLESWINFYSHADVWVVPIEGLKQLFEFVKDVRVEHGTWTDPKVTHSLPAYFQNIEIGDAIAAVLAAPPEE